jgi:phage regulator Rha-like protein
LFSGNVFNLFTVNYEQNCQEKVKHFAEMESKLLGQENELKQYKSLARKQQKQIKQLENSVSKLVIFYRSVGQNGP